MTKKLHNSKFKFFSFVIKNNNTNKQRTFITRLIIIALTKQRYREFSIEAKMDLVSDIEKAYLNLRDSSKILEAAFHQASQESLSSG